MKCGVKSYVVLIAVFWCDCLHGTYDYGLRMHVSGKVLDAKTGLAVSDVQVYFNDLSLDYVRAGKYSRLLGSSDLIGNFAFDFGYGYGVVGSGDSQGGLSLGRIGFKFVKDGYAPLLVEYDIDPSEGELFLYLEEVVLIPILADLECRADGGEKQWRRILVSNLVFT